MTRILNVNVIEVPNLYLALAKKRQKQSKVLFRLKEKALFTLESVSNAEMKEETTINERNPMLSILSAVELLSKNEQIGQSDANSAKTSFQLDSPVSEISQRQSSDLHYCPECDKSFTKLTLLKSHMVMHQPERLHQCDYCPKSFSRRHDMLRHQRSVHKLDHLPQKPYVAFPPYPAKVWDDVAELKRMKRVERPCTRILPPIAFIRSMHPDEDEINILPPLQLR